jgi:hypothetical protein
MLCELRRKLSELRIARDSHSDGLLREYVFEGKAIGRRIDCGDRSREIAERAGHDFLCRQFGAIGIFASARA